MTNRRILTTFLIILATSAPTLTPVLAAGVAPIAAMDDPWQSVLRRWVGDGWKPFHEAGFNFQIAPGKTMRWGAGLTKGQPVTFAAICNGCSGIRMFLIDGRDNAVAQGKIVGNATVITHTPAESGKGTVQFTADGCRLPVCTIRYTSFTRR